MKSYLSKIGVLLFGAMFAVAACQDYDEDIRLVESELTADIEELSTKLDAAIADLENKADQADLEEALELIEQAQKDIAALEAADAAFETKLNAAVAEVQSHIEALYAADQVLTNDLLALTDRVTTNEGKIAAVQTELNSVKEQLVALTNRVAANEKAIVALQDADKVLDKKIEDETAAREQAIEALTTYVDGQIKDVKALITAEETARKAADEQLKKDYEAADAKLKDDLTKLISANTERIVALETAVADLKKVDEQLRKDLTAAQNDITSIKNDLKGLRADVDALLGRIQSVVYVPTHVDGKARVNYVTVGEDPNTKEYYDVNTTEISYRVYPADAAKELADAVNKASKDLTLSYVAKEVEMTKAAAELVEVVSATAKDGVVTLKVKTNFGTDFFKEKKSFSGALVVYNKADKDQIFSTEYVNFVPGNVTGFKFGLEWNEKPYNKENVRHTIVYTSDETVDVLDKVYPVFTQLDKPSVILTEAEFKEAYGIVPAFTVTIAQDPKTTDVFTVTNNVKERPYTQVKLTKVGVLANVGKIINFTHTYATASAKLDAIGYVEVTPETVTHTVTPEQVATWAYLTDAKSDAGLEPTKRTFKISLADIKVDKTLAQTSIADALKGTLVGITVNETAATGITITADDKDLTVVYEGFDWNQKPNPAKVRAEYKLPHAVIYIDFTFKAVDRNREALVIEIGEPSSVEFVKDLKITPFGKDNTFKLESVVPALIKNGNLDTPKDVAELSKDIFVTNAANTTVTNYSKYDAAKPENALTSGSTATTVDLRFDFAQQTFSYAYETTDLTEIYKSMIFAGTFTTWYGQEVTVKHKFNITLPVYDFKHQTYYVLQDPSKVYYSQVTGKYTPEYPTPALEKYEANNIELDKAFYVADKDGNKVADLAKLGLVTDFDIEDATHPGITMSDDNIITYNGKMDKVNVLGKLFIQNTNGTKVELPTCFATTYKDYYVAKYDPIGTLKATNFTQKIENAKVYDIPVLGLFSLKDRRNFVEAYELITPYDAATNTGGTWVAGNDANGFATGTDPVTVYDLKCDWSAVKIPAGYEEIIKFNNGILSFDNTNHMGIVEDINIDITFQINYKWGYREAKVTVTFPKNIK